MAQSIVCQHCNQEDEGSNLGMFGGFSTILMIGKWLENTYKREHFKTKKLHYSVLVTELKAKKTFVRTF